MTETQRVAEFLRGIGIPVRFVDDTFKSFIRGVKVVPTGLVVCERQVKHPHDLFHEAGHLAVTPTRFWPYLDENGTDFGSPPESLDTQIRGYMDANPDGLFSHPEDPVCRAILQMGETEAVAWSYAAMVAAECDLKKYWFPKARGFGGRARDVYEGLSRRAYAGINGLQAAGMTTVRTFPTMKRWLQEM